MKNELFYHNVYFWLKKPSRKKDTDQFLQSLKRFLEVSKYPKSYAITQPANTDRVVVDNSYTYSLLVTFNSKEEHELYQKETVHTAFVNEVSHSWEKVQVFDSVSI